MSERTYYVFCEDNCKFEGMTKEQIYAAIAEATGSTPEDVDDAFITKIKEQNHNAVLKFWRGTKAEYNALTPSSDTHYIITDDDTISEIENTILSLQDDISDLGELIENKVQKFTATIGTSWTGTEAPYTQTISVEGMRSTYDPIVDIVPTGTYATDLQMQDDWSKIYRITTANDAIVVYSKTTVSNQIPIMLKVVQ